MGSDLPDPLLDAFIVLGARLHPQGHPGRVARLRLLHALDLWRGQGSGHFLITGGQMPGTSRSEARAMAEWSLAWVEEHWGPEDRDRLQPWLLLEEASLNTAASARQTLLLVQELDLKAVGLVSDTLHIRRAHYLFRRHYHPRGISVHPLPTPEVLRHYWRQRRYLWLTKMTLREGGAWLKVLSQAALGWPRSGH